MTFVAKPERERNDAILYIAVPRHVRQAIDRAAEEEGTSISAIGRAALIRHLGLDAPDPERET